MPVFDLTTTSPLPGPVTVEYPHVRIKVEQNSRGRNWEFSITNDATDEEMEAVTAKAQRMIENMCRLTA